MVPIEFRYIFPHSFIETNKETNKQTNASKKRSLLDWFITEPEFLEERTDEKSPTWGKRAEGGREETNNLGGRIRTVFLKGLGDLYRKRRLAKTVERHHRKCKGKEAAAAQ